MPYYKALICTKGHVHKHALTNYDEDRTIMDNEKFCPKCGSPLISQCTHCNSPIHGSFYESGVVVLGAKYNKPSYCYSCGKPFPWIDSELKKLNALMAIDACLNDEEKALLLQYIPDLSIEFDGATTSAALIKGLANKAAPATKSFVIELVKSIAIDSVKAMFLQ